MTKLHLTLALAGGLAPLLGVISVTSVVAAENEVPSVIEAVIPGYPDVAFEARLTNLKVLAHLDVDASGKPQAVTLEPALDPMREELESASLRWRFSPALGTNLRRVTLSFLFQLVDWNAPTTERCTILRAPYELLIRRVLPRPVPIALREGNERAAEQ
jgi:hypothetical protein